MRGNGGAGRRWRRAAALVALIGTTSADAGSQERPHRLQSGRFTILAYAADTVLASNLLRQAVTQDSFPSLPRPRDSVVVVIAPDTRSFREAVGPGVPEWGAAFAFPEQRKILLQGRSAPSSAGDPVRVLRHELAHLALYEYLGPLAPRWFDEGYASFAAREWDREYVIAANVGLAFGGFGTLASLDSAFRGGTARADAAYALSYRAVAELASLDPARGLGRLFPAWKEIGSLDRAMRSAHGMTLEGFEATWRSRTRRRYGALALFADVTVGAVMLLLLIGPLYLARRRRDRARLARMRAAEEDQERRERESALAALLAGLDPPPPKPPDGGALSS